MKLTEITTKLNDDKISDIGKKFLDAQGITNYTVREDGLIDVTGSVFLGYNSFTKLPVKFGRVSGNFDCYNCHNLTSLKGVPQEVGGSFEIARCVELTSLEFVPTTVGGSFSCSGCTNLTSLKGAPIEVGADFDCSECTNLTSFAYLPKRINGVLKIMNIPKVKNYLMIIKTYGITVIFNTRNDELNKILTKYLQPLNSKKVPDIIGCQDELIEAGLEEYARTK
jgi:hypothetical protein